ncbi:hypothetical protein [Streptomyces phaeochromogenes]|uniref:hypothetical protein n=1 Tax=Streptomyces phaeochromogenes TaxID=1923 RepID=UPI00371BAA5A
MKLTVAPEVRDLGLRHARAWTLTSDTSLLEPVLSATDAAALLSRFPHEDSALGYRKLISSLGYPDTTPAGERLRQLVAERPWQGHGGVVDAINIASVVVGGGIGLHDLAGLPKGTPLVIRRSPGGERIVPAFSSRSRPIPAGDLTYGMHHPDGTFAPMAWLGKRDSDSAEHQVTAQSRIVCAIALGHPDDSPEHTDSVITVVAAALELLGLRAEIRAVPC